MGCGGAISQTGEVLVVIKWLTLTTKSRLQPGSIEVYGILYQMESRLFDGPFNRALRITSQHCQS